MSAEMLRVEYRFCFPDGRRETFALAYDPVRVEQDDPATEGAPAWTELGFHQCPNCPLAPSQHRHCPLALALSHVVAAFSRVASYEEVSVEVATPDRTVAKQTSVQAGLSSLLGLLQATSHCPHMAFFKPMARFHLPFASPDEVLFRAASSYLLAQYFRHRGGEPVDFALEGLSEHYRQIERVNRAVARRLVAASEEDASVNAVILLDLFAKILPDAVDESLEELRHLYAAYLQQASAPCGVPV